MTKVETLKSRNVITEKLNEDKPMLFNNILNAMDDYAQEQVKNLTLHRVSVSFADFLLTHKHSDEVQKATAHQLFKEFIEAYEP